MAIYLAFPFCRYLSHNISIIMHIRFHFVYLFVLVKCDQNHHNHHHQPPSACLFVRVLRYINIIMIVVAMFISLWSTHTYTVWLRACNCHSVIAGSYPSSSQPPPTLSIKTATKMIIIIIIMCHYRFENRNFTSITCLFCCDISLYS